MADRETEAQTATTGVKDARDEETIRQRAYEISQRDDAGSAHENWQRAQAELEAERTGTPDTRTGTPDTNGES